MKDILFFETMLTPKIITFVYWLLLCTVIISGFSAMFVGYGSSFMMGAGIIVGGVIGVRIFCELLIVLFKINENIKKIADKTDQ